MKFHYLDLDVGVRQLPTKYSKTLNANLKKFAERNPNVKTTNGTVEATDSDTAKFLVDQAYYLLKDAYKVFDQDLESFEDSVTISEVIDFMTAQIEAQGTNDFLVQTLGALISGMKKIVAAVPDIVDKTAREAIATASQ
jgi:hypothetical protein